MIYKAKNVDTDKALKAIEDARKYQDRNTFLEREKLNSFQNGVNKGLDIAEQIFECVNYEKPEEPSYIDGIVDFIDKMGEKLDIKTYDIRDEFSSLDEAVSRLADRISVTFEEERKK